MGWMPRFAEAEPVLLDGREGEGGGQVLRTALSLAVITGRSFVLEHVRARRRPPGLRPQHLECVRAAASLGAAEVRGAVLGSDRIEFRPTRGAQPGEYRFTISTAGASTLLFETVLWPLSLAAGRSQLTIQGGTHNPHAPSFDFIVRSLLPWVAGMGLRLELTLERPGFYPRGGGVFRASVEPWSTPHGLELVVEPGGRGRASAAWAHIVSEGLPEHVRSRELTCLEEGAARLGLPELSIEPARPERGSFSPGNALLIWADWTCGDRLLARAVAQGIGERGKPAERVAAEALSEIEQFAAHPRASMDSHVADQLMLPCALAARAGSASRYHCPAITDHIRTNAGTIQAFLPSVAIEISEAEGRLAFSPGLSSRLHGEAVR